MGYKKGISTFVRDYTFGGNCIAYWFYVGFNFDFRIVTKDFVFLSVVNLGF